MPLQVASLPRASTRQVSSEASARLYGESEKHEKRRIDMPEFGSPFSGVANDRKLTNEELIRAIRFMVAAEYEATQLYSQLAESTSSPLQSLRTSPMKNAFTPESSSDSSASWLQTKKSSMQTGPRKLKQ
jgi:hypothetical protein